MNELQNKMMSKAREMYQEIRPCGAKDSWGECFTTEGTTVVFWFNTPDDSTHVLTAKVH
jgi:hypothetical protein